MKTLFSLGRIVATPGALGTLEDAGVDPVTLVDRHAAGDWGKLAAEDWAENEFSLAKGFRLLSSYPLGNGQKVWIITEADRSYSTILLPSEY